MVEMTKISFNIEKDVKKQVKQIALDKDITATELYVKWIKKGIKQETSQTTLD